MAGPDSPKYAVNPETGQVMRNDGTGWAKVKTAKNQQGEILINEGGTWTPLPGRAPAAPSGFAAPPKMSIAQAADVAGAQGKEFGFADEASALKRSVGIPKSADKLFEANPFNRFLNIGLGAGTAIADAAGVKMSPKYTQAKDAENAQLAQARSDRPVTSFVSEFVQAAPYPSGTLRMGAPIVRETAKMLGLGSLQGAIYGFGSGEGEGRIGSAGTGAVVGGALGAATPGVAAATLPVVRGARSALANATDAIVNMFGGTGTAGQAYARQVAEAAVRRSMERSGMTPERILETLQRFGNKPAVLAEVIGQDAVNTLSSLTRRPGSTPQAAQDIIAERMGGFPERAADDLRQTTGLTDAQIRGEFGPELAARREAAAPAYTELFEQQGGVTSDRLTQLAGTNTLGPLIRRSQAAAEDLAVTQRRDPASVTPLEVLDLAKRELDDEIATAQRNQQNAELFRLQSLQTALLGELDELTGGQYAAARDLGGEAPRLQEARTQGEQALRPGVTRATVNEQVGALNPQDRAAFASGTASVIDESIAGGRMLPQRFRLPANREKVQAAFGEEAGGEFANRMTAEAELRDLASRWGPRQGSITGTVMESGPSEALDDGIRFATSIARGDRIGFINQAVSWMRRRGYNQQQIDAMGELLLSNPQEGLRRLGIQLPRLPGGGGAAAASAAAGTPPPPAGGSPPQVPSGSAPAPRTVGVAPATAAPAGAPAPTTPTRTSGLGIGPNAQATLQQSAFGSLGGSAYGSQNDVNGDGVIDEQDAYAGAFAGGVGLPLAAQGLRTVGQPRVTSGRTVGAGLGNNPYFGRQSMRPPGSGPSAREIETQQQWATATPIVTQARTTAQSAQQAADAALQSKVPADIARAKDQKKTLVGQLQEAQASRAGMDTPEDARLAETLASLSENTSDPVLLSTQISAAKTSLDRLLTDIGSPVEGNLIPVRTNILTRTQAPRSAAEGPQDRASVTRYAEGSDDVQPMGFGAGTPKTPAQAARMQKAKDAASVRLSVGAKATAALDSGNNIPLRASPADMLKAIDDQVKMTSDEKQTFMRVFGDQIRMSRGEAAAFFKTAADPRNHFSHNVEGFGVIAQRMTDEEIQSLSAATAPQVVTILEDLRRITPVQESAAVAVAGGAKKGWYLRSQKALQQVFGDDAPRFASVLAALSPQTSVESNLANAVSFWTNWTKAQRPTDEASILKILGQSVQGDKGDDSVLGAWRNNAVRAIQTANAEDALLSGPKVDSFRRNLRARNAPEAASSTGQPGRRGSGSMMDDTEYAVTNDAWMANYFNVDQELFARGGGKSQPGYSPGYLATNVYVREVAEHLSKVTGERWTPREVQETIWSWAKTLYEARGAGGETRSAAQLVGQKALTDLQIGGTPDFAILLKDNPALRAVLKEAGYEQQLDNLTGASGAVYGDAPGFLGVRSGPQDATGSGFGQRDYERRLGRAAGRLDDLAKRRATTAREERVRTTRFDLAGDGGAPRAYTRGSGRDGTPVRFLGQPVAATYTPESAYQRAYAKNQIEMPDVHELPANTAAGAAYAKRMQEAASRSKFGAAVNVYSPEEYAGMRLFVAADGKSGFALKGDDIVSVWSDPKGPSGRTDALLPLAVQMGGRRLDAFNTVLPQIYAKHGFRIESRLSWNDEFAPTGWDKNTYARFNNGEPDVVFMVWDPAYKGAPRATDGVRTASYEDALTAQAEAQKSIADRIALEYKAPDQPERRTVGKPKTSQSARTVGKAKTN